VNWSEKGWSFWLEPQSNRLDKWAEIFGWSWSGRAGIVFGRSKIDWARILGLTGMERAGIF
jgi:hypothetical protein